MKYSAGFVKEGWFEREFETVLKLKTRSLNRKEILDQIIEENLFQMRSVESIKTRFQMVYRRSDALNEFLTKQFLNGSIYDKNAIILYSFLKTYRILYEFFMEVIITNFDYSKVNFQRGDLNYFFENKQLNSEDVRKWRQQTIQRLISAMILFFQKSGLVNKESNNYYASPLHMSSNLKEYAEKHDKLLLLMSRLK